MQRIIFDALYYHTYSQIAEFGNFLNGNGQNFPDLHPVFTHIYTKQTHSITCCDLSAKSFYMFECSCQIRVHAHTTSYM